MAGVMADAESSSYEGLLAFYEKPKSALAMRSVPFGFVGTNMISKVALNQRQSHFVSELYWHAVVTLIVLPLTYILNRLERIGIIGLAGEAKVVGAIMCIGGILVTLCTINLWSSPLLLKEGNAITDDNESDSKILIKGFLLFVAIFEEFILMLARHLRCLMLQKKGPVFLGLRLGNSRGQIVLSKFLLVLVMIIAVASKAAAVTVNNTSNNSYLIDNTETNSFTAEGVQVGDKLPPGCEYVHNCGLCFPCYSTRKGFLCCPS